MKKQVRTSLIRGMAMIVALVASKGFTADVSVLTRAQWLNKIGESVQNNNELRATLKQVSSADKAEFLQRAVKAVTRMPVRPEEKAAAFVRTVATIIASEAGTAKYALIAEAIADVPVEYLPVVTEKLGKGFAQELNRTTEPHYQTTVGNILKTAVARNAKTDEPAVRDTFAVLAVLRKGDVSASLSKLLSLLPNDRTRSLAASWVPAAQISGNYEAMLAAANVEPLALTAEEVAALIGDSANTVGVGLAGDSSVAALKRGQGLGKIGQSMKGVNVVGSTSKSNRVQSNGLFAAADTQVVAAPVPMLTLAQAVGTLAVDVKDAKAMAATLKLVRKEDKEAYLREAVKAITESSMSNAEKAAAYVRTVETCVSSEAGTTKYELIAEAFAIVPLEYMPVLTDQLGNRFQKEFDKLTDQQYKDIVGTILNEAFERVQNTPAAAARSTFAVLAFSQNAENKAVVTDIIKNVSTDVMPAEVKTQVTTTVEAVQAASTTTTTTTTPTTGEATTTTTTEVTAETMATVVEAAPGDAVAVVVDTTVVTTLLQGNSTEGSVLTGGGDTTTGMPTTTDTQTTTTDTQTTTTDTTQTTTDTQQTDSPQTGDMGQGGETPVDTTPAPPGGGGDGTGSSGGFGNIPPGGYANQGTSTTP